MTVSYLERRVKRLKQTDTYGQTKQILLLLMLVGNEKIYFPHPVLTVPYLEHRVKRLRQTDTYRQTKQIMLLLLVGNEEYLRNVTSRADIFLPRAQI